MDFGIETKDKKCFCKQCKKELNIEVPNQIYNFCPFCDAPLNLVAYNIKKEKENKIKYNVLSDLVKNSKYKTTLVEIKSYMNKISNE